MAERSGESPSHQHGGTVGIGFVDGDGLQPGTGGQGEEQWRVADDAGIHRTGIECFGEGAAAGNSNQRMS